MLLNCGAGASASSQALGERAVEQGVLHQVACIASDVVVKVSIPGIPGIPAAATPVLLSRHLLGVLS